MIRDAQYGPKSLVEPKPSSIEDAYNSDCEKEGGDAPGNPFERHEGPSGISGSLRIAATDARLRPVLDEPETWPGERP